MPKTSKPSSPPTDPRSIHVALLRGINVGGKNKLPMADLAAMFSMAKCANVRTYIQSGNVVFCAKPTAAREIGDAVSKAIADRFDYRIPIVIRSLEALQKVAADNPFLKSAGSDDALHVGFLSQTPDAEKVAALDPQRSPGDSFAIVGNTLYLSLPNGVGRSKLTNAYFDAKLGLISTFRNWKTVGKLLELMKS